MPNGGGGGGGGDPGPILVATASLTKAQILALGTTPVTLIAAPGANKAIILLGGILEGVFGTTAYVSEGSPPLNLTYGGIAFAGNTGIMQVTDGGSSGVLTAAHSASRPLQPLLYSAEGEANSAKANSVIVNQSVTLSSGSVANFNYGPIVTTTLGVGGTGYAANDTGFINPNGEVSSADATYKVLTVDGDGAVLTYQVTAAGFAYPVENGIDTGTGGGQPGSGTGLTLNITAVTTGDGTLNVTLYYTVNTLA